VPSVGDPSGGRVGAEAPHQGHDAGAPVDARELTRVGLCARCTNARRITSAKGSTFWMCTAPGLPKYPPLPVVRCVAFAPRGA
jgi:hypothetical protein